MHELPQSPTTHLVACGGADCGFVGGRNILSKCRRIRLRLRLPFYRCYVLLRPGSRRILGRAAVEVAVAAGLNRRLFGRGGITCSCSVTVSHRCWHVVKMEREGDWSFVLSGFP